MHISAGILAQMTGSNDGLDVEFGDAVDAELSDAEFGEKVSRARPREPCRADSSRRRQRLHESVANAGSQFVAFIVCDSDLPHQGYYYDKACQASLDPAADSAVELSISWTARCIVGVITCSYRIVQPDVLPAIAGVPLESNTVDAQRSAIHASKAIKLGFLEYVVHERQYFAEPHTVDSPKMTPFCFHEFAMLVARMQFQRAKDSVIVYPDAEKFTLCLPGDSLRCPLLIPDLNTKFCNELSRVWQLNFPKLFERASGLKTALEQRTTAHVSAGITEETNGGGMLSLEDAPQPITDCSVWAQLIVQKNYELAFNKAAYPLPGMACIVQPLCNYQHIMVVPLELVLNETYGVDALIANLVANSKKKREDQTFSLAAFPIFGVRRGVCVYVPFGYVPLIVSTDSELEPNGSSYIPDYGVHILWYIGHWNEETDESVRFETLNSLRKSATQTKSLSKYSKELLAFHATHDMPPVEEETAPKEI